MQPRDSRYFPAGSSGVIGLVCGCVRLWPDDAVTLGLGAGEGIET